MRVATHIVSGAALAGIVGHYHGWPAALWVGLPAMFLDIDHYLWYTFRMRTWSLSQALSFFDNKGCEKHDCLCLLHTLEMIALYVCFTLFFNGPIFWFGLGALFHMLLDVISGLRKRGLRHRRWSLVYYLRGV